MVETTETAAPLTTVEVRRFGRVWADDARSRDIDLGEAVRETEHSVWLSQTEEERAEMRSAADYDFETWKGGGFDGFDARPLGEAARRVIGVLDRHPLDEFPTVRSAAADAARRPDDQQRMDEATAEIARRITRRDAE